MVLRWRAFGLGAALAVAATAGACAGLSRTVPVAGPDDLARGSTRFPDLTGAELADGRALFVNRCGNCHVPPDPASRTPESWPEAVHEMKVRARLDANQERLVQRYVVTMSIPVAHNESGSSR